MPLQLLAPGYPTARLLASVTRILNHNTLCSMATRSEAGSVDINVAFFSLGADLTLYFLSNPNAAHCRNLTHVPQMAMTVFDSHQQWGESHAGLQLFGAGATVLADHLEQARTSYAARFAGYFDLVIRAAEASAPPTGPAALRLYAFAPTRAKILDELEFGDEIYITAEIVR
jgi:uncharacterized protein YhbP (UPF0306 family)